MSNIDKQALRDIAAAAESAPLWHAVGVFGEVVDPANPEWKPVHDFCKTFTAERVLALLDELEAKDKRIGELEAREKSLRTVGVMSQKAYQRLEGRESRFIALWPRPEIYLPRKRPKDGVIVYARVACTGEGE
ncbi:ead/Ea22-like family protein [Enterobacter cloacae]